MPDRSPRLRRAARGNVCGKCEFGRNATVVLLQEVLDLTNIRTQEVIIALAD